ncbi:MAG: hypothetical protein Q4G70_15795 [Pseudomonadota bacterium]|nr:hypothetical protein [Pseudomonadota bacterium]
MGWDISYHPVASEEIKSIYFRGLADPNFHEELVARFGVDEFYAEQLKVRFEEARRIEQDVPFNKGHAFYAAIIFGFLRKYNYIRGGAFSFLADDPVFSPCVTDWRTLVPEDFKGLRFNNALTENYCGGVFISHDGLLRLREMYEKEAHAKSALDENFSHGRLNVFWKAVDEALAEGCGLLEASEVIEPNPLDLNSSRCLSNLFNCHPDGALLYAEAAMEQLNEVVANQEPPKKKSWFARLFG